MEHIEPDMPAEGRKRILAELTKLYVPLRAAKEFITNSVDAVSRDPTGSGLITVLLSPPKHDLIVQDSAEGMDEATVRSLPKRIGFSAKAGHADQRGEKAVGLLAFGSLGSRMELISRRKGDNRFSHLKYEVNDGALEVGFDTLSELDMESDFYGSFERGTKVILQVNPQIFGKQFAGSNLRNYIQDTYLPLLISGKIPIWFGKVGEGNNIIDAPIMRGVPIFKGTRTFEAKKKSEVRAYNFFGQLMFNPDAEEGRVGVYSKDVKVYNTILDLEEELGELDLWRCRQVTGFINEPSLSLTLGRDGIQKNSNAFRGLVETLKELNAELWPGVSERLASRKIARGNKFVSGAWTDLGEAYKMTAPLNRDVRTSTQVQLQGVQIPEKNIAEKRENGAESTHRHRRFPFGMPAVRDFDIHEKNQRSKLDSEMGEPILVINSGHPDYQANVVSSNDEARARAYVFDIATPVIALWEAKDLAERKGGSLGDPYAMASEISRRAQDLKYAILKNKR